MKIFQRKKVPILIEIQAWGIDEKLGETFHSIPVPEGCRAIKEEFGNDIKVVEIKTGLVRKRIAFQAGFTYTFDYIYEGDNV